MKRVYVLFILLYLIGFPVDCFSQYVTLKGTVQNSSTGEMVEYANVVEVKSGIGTISNSNGFFSLMLLPGEKAMSISMEGFKSVSYNLVLKKDTTLNASIEPLPELKNRHKSAEINSASIAPLKKK